MKSNINKPPNDENGDENNQDIEPFEEWRQTAGSKCKYGHYAEYVVRRTLGIYKVKHRKATDEEDSPGGGDIVMMTPGRRVVFIDVKLKKENQSDTIEGRVHSETEGELNIHPTCVKRLQSKHRSTQYDFLQKIFDLLVAMDEKYNEINNKR
ncbi:MAG TPA: hypothetical protein PKK54_00105 [bacterium]|jgi:hypothetical protein|nr:hypothetical protein [bacterium]